MPAKIVARTRSLPADLLCPTIARAVRNGRRIRRLVFMKVWITGVGKWGVGPRAARGFARVQNTRNRSDLTFLSWRQLPDTVIWSDHWLWQVAYGLQVDDKHDSEQGKACK